MKHRPEMPFAVRGATNFVTRPTGQRGMTLAEILVALPIIAIGLVALMQVIPYAASHLQSGATISTATFLSNAKLDDLKNIALRPGSVSGAPTPADHGFLAIYDTATPPNCTGVLNDPLTPLAGTEVNVPVNGSTASGYARTTEVADVPGSAPCTMKQITVTTTYRGAVRAVVWMQLSPR